MSYKNITIYTVLILLVFYGVQHSFGDTVFTLPALIQNGNTIIQRDTTATTSLNNLQLKATTTVGYVLTATTTAGNAVWYPAAAGGGSGTVTSVAMTVPTGLTISVSPITVSGTAAL